MEDREAVTPGKKFPRRKVEKYFQKLQKNGTELYVDGEKVSPSQAAAYAVREESPYMADYILGEQGKGGSALKGVSSCPGNTLKQRMRCGDAKRDCLSGCIPQCRICLYCSLYYIEEL